MIRPPLSTPPEGKITRYNPMLYSSSCASSGGGEVDCIPPAYTKRSVSVFVSTPGPTITHQDQYRYQIVCIPWSIVFVRTR